MQNRTFSDFAGLAVAGALLTALIVAAVQLGPLAVQRWFGL